MTSTRTGIAHQPPGQTTIEYLSLEEVRVRAWVVDVSSRIVLTQTFYNPSDQPTGRAKYVFPLPANAAVCAFELQLEDGSVVVGEVKGKEDATLAFARAVDEGKVAALVERVTDDSNIHDLSRIYSCCHAAMHNTSAADSRTRVHINVDVQTSDVIYSIRSPTHHIALQRYKGRSGHKSQRRMSVVWRSSEFLASDFVITINAKGMDKPRCFAEVLHMKDDRNGEGSTIAMQLTLVPKFQAPKIPSQEYIFIIDRSSSMTNVPIETAKKTLIMLLRLLPSKQTTFNIFSFGTKVDSLWPTSRALDPASVAKATSHVAGMSANYGGTEIPQALQSAFNSRVLDRPAVVFLLTDGQIYSGENLDPFVVIFNAVQNAPPHAPTRLFVLGIGTGVSSDVCTRLAREGNGEYLFALSAEDICENCAGLLNAGRSKNIERIDIDWSNDTSTPAVSLSSPTTLSLPAGFPALGPLPPVQQAPHSLKRIFSGFRFTVFAITSFKTVPTSVRLITKLDGVPEPQELIVGVMRVKPFSNSNEHSIVPMVHTLAARRLIMELDGGVAPPPAPAPGDALLVSEDDLRKAGIVRLGLTYQLVSEHTSFVAVQEGGEQRGNRGRRNGSMAWARSRFRQTRMDSHENDSPTEATTFLDGLINGVASFITTIFGFARNPATLTSATSATFGPHSHRHRPSFPGAYDESDFGTSENRSRRSRRTSRSPRGRSLSSRGSANTLSTLSSLEGSSCSSCWTASRSPSPVPRFHDQTEPRAPSPDFLRDTSTQGPGAPNVDPSGGSNKRHPIPQEVYDLFRQMDIDGSFPLVATPLLSRLVGEGVLGKADELGIDKKVWATVVVVAYIQTRLQDAPNLLDLMSEKGKEFVEGCEWFRRNGARQFDEMVREAVGLLSPASPGPSP